MKTKIGILGGTFNPVHDAHIQIAKMAKLHMQLDEVWFVPTFITSDKNELEFISATHRLNMIKLAIEEIGESYMSVSDIEVSKNVISYTYMTMQELATKYPEYEFYFIMGDDRFNTLDKWRKPSLIAKYSKFIVLNREGKLRKELVLKYNPILVGNKAIDISSTKIRRGYLEKIPLSVRKYIAHNFLYLYTFLYAEQYEDEHERFNHGLNTANMAKTIASRLEPELTQKAYYAGLLHDFCKNWDKTYMRREIKKHLGFEVASDNLLHQFMASIWIKNVYLLDDEQIIDAIKWHTTGRPHMSTLEKIVYIADKVSIERNYPEAAMFREMAYKNIDQTFLTVYENIYKFIDKNKEPIKDQFSSDTYKYYFGKKNVKSKKQ